MHAHCANDLISAKKNTPMSVDRCLCCRAETPSSAEDRIKYLRPWVNKDKAWAQQLMAQHYHLGVGVECQYEVARRLYELSAQKGDVLAMNNLGLLYENGLGVEKSLEHAIDWYKKAAKLGLAMAQFNLGYVYSSGKVRSIEDYLTAKEYFCDAAVQGHEGAAERLRVLKNANMIDSHDSNPPLVMNRG